MVGSGYAVRRWIGVGAAVAVFVAAAAYMLGVAGGGSQAEASDVQGISDYLASAHIPDDQKAAVADGYVTFAEHETAIQATIACATAAGVRMQATPGEGLRPTRLGFVAADDAELRASQKALDTCVQQYLSIIETVRGAQPAEAGAMERASSALANCLDSRIPGSGDDGGEKAKEILGHSERSAADWAFLRAWDECRFAAEADTGFLP